MRFDRSSVDSSVHETIFEIERQIQRGWTARNLGAILTHYEPSATVIVPGVEPACGHDAIAKLYGRALGDPNFDLAISTLKLEVATGRDYAYSTGIFADRLSKDGHVVATTGHHVWIWRQLAGSWVIVHEISVRGPLNSEEHR
jgi:ketosteroid isomerase-like protein